VSIDGVAHARPENSLQDEDCIDTLQAFKGLGRLAKLDERQLLPVRPTLLRSPTEDGFGNE
jgi:hypothetical protein